MPARLALLLSVVFLAAMAGLASAPRDAALVTPLHPLRLASLRLDPPGVRAAEAAAVLAGGERPPAPPAGAVSPPPPRPAPVPTLVPAAPPPPEPASVLRASVAAVTSDDGRLGLVLAGGGRRLHEGDAFLGWRLASVTRTRAVLTKGAQRRDVSFFDAPAARAVPGPGPTPVAAPPVGPPGQRPVTAEEFFRGFKG